MQPQPPKRLRRHKTPQLFSLAKKLDQHPQLRKQVTAALAKHLK